MVVATSISKVSKTATLTKRDKLYEILESHGHPRPKKYNI